VKNLKDARAVLGYLVFCLTLLLSAGFMIFEIVEYAHPEWKAQPWGSHAKGQ
jgi:heme/copper-type cytochrome/quinol oxidase subunit 3